jgi:hypothetical protein
MGEDVKKRGIVELFLMVIFTKKFAGCLIFISLLPL